MAKIKSVAQARLGSGMVFVIAGLLFLVIFIFIVVENNNFMETAKETTAVVTEVRKERVRRNGKYRTDYDVYVYYEVDGVAYNQEINGGNASMKKGQKLVVYYNPENPRDVRSGGGSGIKYFGVVFSLAFTVIGVLVGIVPAVKANKLKKLKETGNQTTAMITDIVIDKSIRINKRYPNKAICEEVDPVTNEKYLYSSDGVMGDISYLQGQLVTVYYDPYDKSRYYVDLESVDMNTLGSQQIHDYR